jgi:hypothetical protein
MKTRYLLYPALTGLVAAILMLIAVQTAGTSTDWLQAKLFTPGQLITALLFSKGGQPSTSPVSFFVEFALNFVFTWIGLLFITFFLDKLSETLYELTKN